MRLFIWIKNFLYHALFLNLQTGKQKKKHLHDYTGTQQYRNYSLDSFLLTIITVSVYTSLTIDCNSEKAGEADH